MLSLNELRSPERGKMFIFWYISIFRNMFLSFVFSQGIRVRNLSSRGPQQETEQKKNKTKIEGNTDGVLRSGNTPPPPPDSIIDKK